MELYLSLLRGINIGGHNKILMPDLQKLYEDLGFKNITSYIQSGNVIFKGKPDKKVASKIEDKIFERFQLRISVLIRNVEQIKMIIEKNPFPEEAIKSPDKLCVVFSNKIPDDEKVEAFSQTNYASEKYVICENEIYLYCKNGFGRAKLNTNFFERKLDIVSTARNWKTVQKLYELLLDQNDKIKK